MAGRKTIINDLVKEYKLTKVNAKDIVNQVFITMGDALKRGEQVKISKFGTFYPREIKPFKGYNLLKKTLTQYKGGKTVKLKPSKILRTHLEAA